MSDLLHRVSPLVAPSWQTGTSAPASAFFGKGRPVMLILSISDRMPLPLAMRLTLDVSARVARMVGRASNKEGES